MAGQCDTQSLKDLLVYCRKLHHQVEQQQEACSRSSGKRDVHVFFYKNFNILSSIPAFPDTVTSEMRE